jgi:hypothetical protein
VNLIAFVCAGMACLTLQGNEKPLSEEECKKQMPIFYVAIPEILEQKIWGVRHELDDMKVNVACMDDNSSAIIRPK